MSVDQDKASPSTIDTGWTKPVHTGVLVLASGESIAGFGLGAVGEAVGEVCFNTAMTGYQEILTDPSYAAQIVTFTFPHIGNVGTNAAAYTIYPDLQYTPASFAPIGLVAKTMPAIALRKDFPAASARDFLDFARANPGKVTLGHAGVEIGRAHV